MIPKKIHYCWFGGTPLPELTIKCLDSWKKFCPDYEIIQWNERNFDVDSYAYTREAYAAKKWAFVSDVARLHALTEQGGVYLDTDMELLATLDSLLDFEGVIGFETNERVGAGLIGCVSGFPLIQSWLDSYERDHFINIDGTCDLTTCVERVTNLLTVQGLELNNHYQHINGCAIFPKDVFYPKDMETGKTTLTEHSMAIHHYDGSWLSEEDKLAGKFRQKLKKVFPQKVAGRVAKFLAMTKCKGFVAAVRETVAWLKRRRG